MLSLIFSYDIVYNSHLFIYTVVKFPEHENLFIQSTIDREVILSFAWVVKVLPGLFWSLSPYLGFIFSRVNKRGMFL